MDIQKAIELKKNNFQFYGFESEIEINQSEVQIVMKGSIEEEFWRITFAMFILELIEVTKLKNYL